MPAKKPAARTGKPRKSATKATAAKKPAARKPTAPKAKAKPKPKRAAVRQVAAKSPRKSPKKVPAKPRKAAPAKASKPVKAVKATAKTKRGARTVAKHKATASRSSAKSAGVKVKAKAAPRKPAVKAAVKPTKAAKRAAPAPRKAARPPKVVAMPSRARQAEAVAEDDEGYEGYEGEGRHDLLMGPRNVKPYIQRRGESYMSTTQLQHFGTILSAWKRDLMEEVDRTVTHMKDEAANPPDPNDRATLESEFALELRTRDRERKLIRKIDEALKRIDDGSYGFCLETGEAIGVKRLEARPVATLCIEAQERRERRERQYGDRDDWYR